ncbi:hypothetical protein SAMN02745857_02769 [Andreprevotia lacus DSM 23236]|uniref:Uncharacterized protein n=1 Tax=Andreprevotia lacus DSM 23236 TaxID=1121001 RepID=A0A1W1XTR0_9NEIS|nr:hypothetical protein [Andreprevotia lacus]SMC27254.1 hypothetical protein SAMN02745857_02769 [Andreprevotia lacus DSM 23236]
MIYVTIRNSGFDPFTLWVYDGMDRPGSPPILTNTLLNPGQHVRVMARQNRYGQCFLSCTADDTRTGFSRTQVLMQPSNPVIDFQFWPRLTTRTPALPQPG